MADGARRPTEHLKGRGAAAVGLAYLPDQANGSKTGADDFLAGGHGYREMAATSRPFDAEDPAADLRARLQLTERAQSTL